MHSNLSSTAAALLHRGSAHPIERWLDRHAGAPRRVRAGAPPRLRLVSIEGRSRPADSDAFARLFARAGAPGRPTNGAVSALAKQPELVTPESKIARTDVVAACSTAIRRTAAALVRLGDCSALDPRRTANPAWNEVMSFVVVASLIAAALLI